MDGCRGSRLLQVVTETCGRYFRISSRAYFVPNDFPILAILVSLHLHLIGAFGLLRDRIRLLFVRLQ
jgi:hypothetical protein